MSNYAKIENGIVENVIICNDSYATELDGTYVKILDSHGNVSVGFYYDSENNRFKSTQPYPSWIFNEDLYIWEAPEAKPNSGKWLWNESNQEWFEVVVPE